MFEANTDQGIYSKYQEHYQKAEGNQALNRLSRWDRRLCRPVGYAFLERHLSLRTKLFYPLYRNFQRDIREQLNLPYGRAHTQNWK